MARLLLGEIFTIDFVKFTQWFNHFQNIKANKLFQNKRHVIIYFNYDISLRKDTCIKFEVKKSVVSVLGFFNMIDVDFY